MNTQATLEWKLARLAHEKWCARMAREGWKQGKEFDADRRLHDALVPFDELSPVDRRSVYLGIVVSEVAKEIEGACEYSRGDDRELGAAELQVGMRVRHADEPEGIVCVEGWQENPEFPGVVNWIRVKWHLARSLGMRCGSESCALRTEGQHLRSTEVPHTGECGRPNLIPIGSG